VTAKKPSEMNGVGDLPHYYIEITNSCYVCHVLQQILNSTKLLQKALLEVYEYSKVCDYHKQKLSMWENGNSTILKNVG